MQVERWRQMTPAEKLRQVSDLRETVLTLSGAGIRTRHPGIEERELFLRLMILTLGLELARKGYPEIQALDDPRP